MVPSALTRLSSLQKQAAGSRRALAHARSAGVWWCSAGVACKLQRPVASPAVVGVELAHFNSQVGEHLRTQQKQRGGRQQLRVVAARGCCCCRQREGSTDAVGPRLERVQAAVKARQSWAGATALHATAAAACPRCCNACPHLQELRQVLPDRPFVALLVGHGLGSALRQQGRYDLLGASPGRHTERLLQATTADCKLMVSSFHERCRGLQGRRGVASCWLPLC